MNAEGMIWDALRGGLVTRALGLAADLRVAQALAAGPRSHDALARASGASTPTFCTASCVHWRATASLRRPSQAFSATQPPRRCWHATAGMTSPTSSAALGCMQSRRSTRAERRHSRASIVMSSGPGWRRIPMSGAGFDRAMGQGWHSRLDRLQSVDWRGDELVVDVGGGNGSLLYALLQRNPRIRGIVFDLPETVRDEQALGDRCRFVEGSFFQSVPHGDVHLLSTILHDWDDDSAQRILETVRAAAGERLVVLDGVIEPGNAPDGAKWLDLLMLVIAGGRERTAEQWRVLLGDAGGRATRVGEGVIEAQPA